ncbi:MULTISPECIES: PepSY-like domain-containing protein [unclassified Campylobacter]|uniref:PepSY-like domain-containing protein n=1 Tax=unclassified Campylobacter TaxID=2593542 RepID=UPI001237F56F|nr:MULTISPECIES: PepSY-like domain-containing protein [unclassified Campylobacter]KAA6224878.1 hypothetical protein FMM54_06810 [Campylobacter sp. LR185c]KAA6226337.1 hypothetical protein FMM57_06030 [Campylobacter sp. LR286c]KAA6226829.1 hypothetical protein FMM55_04600 [Campylobacter sp. LR196d]KAA6230266.1 hypothetical protein FMM58_06230 [Campylobacter sp. LR291e]KAA6233787.1 hypothetical protein FMM56_02450 [Campylobacter sp. LR264d]
MKFKFLIISILISKCLSGGFILSPDALPQLAKEFIAKHFSNAQIGMVQMDKNTYEVYLTDGTELEFYIDGNWKEIEAKFNVISFNILPPNLASIMQNNFPNTAIIEIKRKANYYKIELTNHLEVIMDFNGTILNAKYD